MVAIQVVLTIMALCLFALFIQRAHTVRTQAVKRIGFVLFIFGAVYAILRPQDVDWVAHRLGVGRGADLVLYMLVVVVAFFAANTFLRFRSLERRFTDLARAVALSNAEEPAPHIGPQAPAPDRERSSSASSPADGPEPGRSAPVGAGSGRGRTP
ncbi:MAG: DUF2304 family protein [Catenulispora sp.]